MGFHMRIGDLNQHGNSVIGRSFEKVRNFKSTLQPNDESLIIEKGVK
jgi:hypothetical protein